MMLRLGKRRQLACVEVVRDAASTQSDPTGTLPLRKSLARDLDARWALAKRAVLAQIGKQDILALGPESLHHQLYATAEDRLRAAQGWVDSLLSQRVLGHDAGEWLAQGTRKAYGMGAARAAKALRRPLEVSWDKASGYSSLAVIELQGVAEAVSQQVLRSLAASIASGAMPAQAALAAARVVDAVGVARGRAVISVSAVKAYTGGTLDALEAGGVRRVSVVPESAMSTTPAKPALAVGDANPNQPRNRSGQFRPYQRPASRETFRTARRAERNFSGLGMVNVLTAGDDDVCPRCEDIAASGPYTIDEARGLIPAHPSCRCAFDPVEGDDEVNPEEE